MPDSVAVGVSVLVCMYEWLGVMVLEVGWMGDREGKGNERVRRSEGSDIFRGKREKKYRCRSYCILLVWLDKCSGRVQRLGLFREGVSI